MDFHRTHKYDCKMVAKSEEVLRADLEVLEPVEIPGFDC